uniref:VWFD domain-containing protein n=1 Tax=Xenopus tropicalis TaxID=8364 RepID=A0A6I8SGM7_XENTR
PIFKGKVCGLCGNFDDKSSNDLLTRNMLEVSNVREFANSWKFKGNCPDEEKEINACSQNPYRRAWAEKRCYRIKSEVFQDCHSKVDPIPFYEACVNDVCSCDTGGDCESFCTAVSAYAQECNKAGSCIHWRTPDICPIFCDNYHTEDEWQYKPCGNDEMPTCNSIYNMYTNITHLEGEFNVCLFHGNETDRRYITQLLQIYV